jgi:O-antigen/teichoic acid export membrane protein
MQDELPRFRARLLDACRLLAFVAMPVLWGISAVSPEFVSLTLGERWLDAIFPLQVVTLIIPIRMISAVFGTSVSALGRADVDVRNMLLSCIVLPIAFLSGVQWGVQGLALSWVGAVPLLFYLNYSRMRRVLGIRLRDVGAAVFGSIAAGVTMYIAVSGARLVLNAMPEAYRFGALIAVGATTYLFVATRLDKKIWIDVKRLATALKE